MDAGGGNLLVYGATGSGKTEVYLQACAAALERGLGAIVLVPEIALAPQTVGRVRARFGDRVAILHSALSDAERRDERVRIASGEARIVVGARSAIFAPVQGLGLIVVDEEHDSSYKQDSDPRYDARTVAAKRAVARGSGRCLRLGDAASRELGGARTALARRADRRRRCRPCGSSTCAARPATRSRRRCSRRCAASPSAAARRSCCSTAAGSRRRCTAARAARPCAARTATSRSSCTATRRCAATTAAIATDARSNCRVCGSPDLARLGAGTQKLERELRREVPRARADPARRGRDREAGAAGRLARAVPRCRGAVLLGTQMVAKGHHFAGVELAAVIDADTGLAMPDFRAEERTFQLVTQLAGRSGRDAPGRVIVQTFQPDSRTIAHAARHDVERLPRGGARAPTGPRLSAVRASGAGRRHRPRARAGAARARGAEGGRAGRASCSARRRCCACAASTAHSWSRRRSTRGESRRRQRACSPSAAPAMRRARLTAVVDVDPQSL